MNTVQFHLRLKKERIYSERIVELGEGVLKYFKKENPTEIRFSASLLDIIVTEKYKNVKSKYKLIIYSKTNSFPPVKFKSISSNDVNPLIIFKNSLENHINYENTKNKSEGIVMRIANEETILIKREDDDVSPNCTIKRSTLKGKLDSKKPRLKENFETLCFKNIENFKDYERDTEIFEKLLRLEFNFFKVKNNILFETTNHEILSKTFLKLNDDKESFFVGFSNMIQNKVFTEKKLINFLNIIVIILVFILICYNCYTKNYLSILFVAFTFVYLRYSIKNILKNKDKKSNTPETIQTRKSISELNLGKYFIKSKTIMNQNIFVILKYLLDKYQFKKLKNEDTNSELVYKNYCKISENIIILTESITEDLMNLYHLKSNSSFTKTKITFLSAIKYDDPKLKVRDSMYSLKNFINFCSYDITNKIHFENNEFEDISKYQDYLKLLK